MFELLFDNAFFKVCLVLLSAPLWWPVLRTIWSELQRVGSEPRRATVVQRQRGARDGLDLGSARHTDVGVWSLEEEQTWSKRRLLNPAWDRGQRQRRPQALEERGSLTTRILNATDSPGGGSGRQPL